MPPETQGVVLEYLHRYPNEKFSLGPLLDQAERPCGDGENSELRIASSGLIVNEYNCVLMIFDELHWVLPQGAVDPEDESLTDAVLRSLHDLLAIEEWVLEADPCPLCIAPPAWPPNTYTFYYLMRPLCVEVEQSRRKHAQWRPLERVLEGAVRDRALERLPTFRCLQEPS